MRTKYKVYKFMHKVFLYAVYKLYILYTSIRIKKKFYTNNDK